MANLKKVRDGDALEFSATAYNAFVDAALAHRQGAPPVAGPLTATRQTDIVLVKNNTASGRDALDVLGIDNPAFSFADNANLAAAAQMCLVCSAPAADDHTGKFVILLEAIPAGKVGRAILSGVVACHLVVADESHKYADITDGDPTTLTSASVGAAQILWYDSTTASDWAIVRLGVPPGPFSGVIEFIGSCLIQEASPDTQSEGTQGFTVRSDLGGSSCAPSWGGTAENKCLLVKLATPTPIRSASRIFCSLGVDVTWKFGDSIDASSVDAGFVWYLDFITENFNTSGGSCPTWNAQPAVTTGEQFAPSVTISPWKHSEPLTYPTLQWSFSDLTGSRGADWTSPGADVYGFRVRPYLWVRGVNGSATLYQTEATLSVDIDQSLLVY